MVRMDRDRWGHTQERGMGGWNVEPRSTRMQLDARGAGSRGSRWNADVRETSWRQRHHPKEWKKVGRPFLASSADEVDVGPRPHVRPADAVRIHSSAFRDRFLSLPSSSHTIHRTSRSFFATFRSSFMVHLVHAIFPVASPTTRWIAPHVIGHVRPYLATVSHRGGSPNERSPNERSPIDGSGSVAPTRSTVQGNPAWKGRRSVPSNPTPKRQAHEAISRRRGAMPHCTRAWRFIGWRPGKCECGTDGTTPGVVQRNLDSQQEQQRLMEHRQASCTY